MGRKLDGNLTIANLARRLGIDENTFRNSDNRKTRKDKKLSTMRKEALNKLKKK